LLVTKCHNGTAAAAATAAGAPSLLQRQLTQ